MKKTKNTPKTDKNSTGIGWLTTDIEEIERRRQRARKEAHQLEALDSAHGAWQLTTESGTRYQIELRSLHHTINSCDCRDFESNGLGTCKHIEAVLFQQHLPTQPPTEIWLDRRIAETDAPHKQPQPVIRILWPNQLRKNGKLYQLLSPYFSENGELLAAPLTGMAAIQQAVDTLPARSRSGLRISRLIPPWLQQLRQEEQRKLARSGFLKDVASGKRSLDLVNLPLYDYQQDGAIHLAFKGRAILADEMGLGKTAQAIAAAELLAQTRKIERVLVLSPVSLKTEWEEQIEKFTKRSTLIIQGNRTDRLHLYRQNHFFYLANYEQTLHDAEEIQNILAPDLIILDEAQRIKNWQAKTANAVKALNSPFLFVLTGTPLENRIDEIYSIAQAIDPQLFGPLFRFNRDFYRLDERGRPQGVRNLDALYRRLQPILLRRRKQEVEGELPDRTINTYFVGMEPEQEERYGEYSAQVARIMHAAKQRPLRPEEFKNLQSKLACMRMLCDTPYILDSECRISPKLEELKKIFAELFVEPDPGTEPNKVILFSEWTRMLELIQAEAEQQGIEYALHTGAVHQKKRRLEINRFKSDPACRLFLTSDAGATGLNLQAANIVINVDLPWNPAKLEQRIARAWRKHQKRAVQVINLVCENSIEHRILHILDQKKALADGVLDGEGVTEMDLPSGRGAMLERLEALMEERPTTVLKPKPEPEPEPKINPLQQLQQEVEARAPGLGGSITEIENARGEKHILAVAPDSQQKTVEEALQASSDPVELIDPETLALLKRLADAGAITLNSAMAQLLPDHKEEQQRQQERTRARIKKAQQQLSEAERPLKMAQLLFDGGFQQEALSPLCEAIKTGAALLIEAEESKKITQTGLPPEQVAFVQLFTKRQPKECDSTLLKNSHTLIHEIGVRLQAMLLSG
ncbi:MAG: DEAD/DEAH box helicase family protein [Gammaproteobacteria bacterium]|nr:DEAD/DEAH box helicase family protein [Gammaproteobacteria bacterium]